MVRAQLVPFRWVSHGLDVRAHLGDEPLFVAGDICKALGLQIEYGVYDRLRGITPTIYPLPTEQVEGMRDAQGAPVAFFTVDQVRELAADRPMHEGDDFATWFDSILADHGGDRLEQLVDALTPAEPGLLELHAGRTFSISRAAVILSGDPALNYGQTTLFATLSGYMNWIHRVDGIWTPTPEVLRAGYLVRHHVPAGPRKTLYPQIRVTRSGLEHLHRKFGGIAALNLDSAPALTLLELK